MCEERVLRGAADLAAEQVVSAMQKLIDVRMARHDDKYGLGNAAEEAKLCKDLRQSLINLVQEGWVLS